MVGVLIVIAVLGIGLPGFLWLILRWRLSVPQKVQGVRHDEIDKWLVSEFNLGWRDRSRVRRAVLAWQDAYPASLKPALLEAARGLAARVLADQIRQLRLSRRVGWTQLGMTVAGAGYGILVLATGWGGTSALGAFLVFNAGISGASAVFNAVLTPRRIRRNAEQVLRIASPESP
jgi:hypothetical protein